MRIRNRLGKRNWWGVGAVLVVVAVIGLGLGLQDTHSKIVTTHVDIGLLHSLKQQTNSTIDLSHVASGVVPPTNHWFSGLALNKQPMAVFPLPLSFKPSNSGFSFGLPTVTATANTIAGGYVPDVTADMGAGSYQVSRYDSVSVSLQYRTSTAADMGTLTIAEGSPFVSYDATAAQSWQLASFSSVGDNTYVQTIGAKQYAFTTQSTASYNGKVLQLQAGAHIVLYAVANGTTAQAMAANAEPLASVVTSYDVDAKNVKTNLQYKTASGDTALYAALPTQHMASGTKVTGTYNTIYGTMMLYTGKTFSFTAPKVSPSMGLDVSSLSSSNTATLVNTLNNDAANTNLTKTDSYYGGKELYRAANLLLLAKQLGQKSQAATLQSAIKDDLSQWFDPMGYTVRDNRYFYYDTTAKGLVAAQPSFGSEQFNDHHFHYGYFLYAAAVLSKYDSSFAKKYQPFVQLIADDIAAPTTTSSFSQLRVFDPYVGHSWASGYGQFNDGNNQESSSEAINAWNGLGAWAQVTGDTTLANQATWQLSNEVASASADWTDPDLSAKDLSGFAHQTVGINWGGKRDYATFFSAQPAAILGIQLIPMSPAMAALASQGNRITTNLSTVLPDGNYDQQFGDYLLMYRSLQDKPRALQAAQNLPSTNIDDANSRTYMLAWIMSR